MTALGNINAGARVTAAMLQGVAPDAIIKGADQQVLNSTTLVNDSALFLTLPANTTWAFVCNLDYEGAATGTGDLKWKWSVPSGATMRYTRIGYLPGSIGSPTVALQTEANTPQGGTNGAAVLEGQFMFGSVVMGGTAGALQLTWAQQTANASVATIVHAGSILALWQVS